jgi:hypothetical protein
MLTEKQAGERRTDVHVQGMGACLDKAATDASLLNL